MHHVVMTITLIFSLSSQAFLIAPPHRGVSSSILDESSSSSLSVLSSSSSSIDESITTFGSEIVQKSRRHRRGRGVTPYEILDPDLFSEIDGDNGSDIQLPLSASLEILEQSLHKINDYIAAADDLNVLRIELSLSHTVDPLCWLQSVQQQQEKQHHAAVYFCNANQTLEAAAYGSAYLHHGAASEELWDFLHHDLPSDSRVYGGERFDQSTFPDDEWSDFGSGLWMLPMIEVRRRRQQDDTHDSSPSVTTVAVHVVRDKNDKDAAWNTGEALQLLNHLINSRNSGSSLPFSSARPLPPVISRDSYYHGTDQDAQDVYERGVTAALQEFQIPKASALKKVVLAQRSTLIFDKAAASSLDALSILCKWKFGGNEGGHLFYLRPPGSTSAFFGCTPEQLFHIKHGSSVVTEALAGTRPRGSTQEADMALSRDLFESPKDRSENDITSQFIVEQLDKACHEGLLVSPVTSSNNTTDDGKEDRYFVRRLRHLQHICQRFEYDLCQDVSATRVAQYLLQRLNPTPAVCGFPLQQAQQFIQRHERTAFDRGFYAGPFGYIGSENTEIVVAIRSGLLSKAPNSVPTIAVYAGAGIVPGSSVQGEWSETSYKLNVVSSLFPQSPITLLSATTPNVAWANAFLEELIRCGIVQFYVCPGSRSTPLVAALAKALRQHVGILSAVSVHDERGAAFRAIGYARATGRPAAVVTSSGTATANLYPAIMEAGMDGVPLLLLTADRPYESRDTGANQAVDQVKTYSSTYVRWFRDIPPPSDDVPVSIALADANHGYHMALEQKGPVHINIQFRENLAPDAGSIRNDGRVGSLTKFNGFRFTDVPNFARWSKGGGQWLHASHSNGQADGRQLADLIRSSKRGIIVVGNLRPESGQGIEDQVEAISHFAQSIGFPIFASIQSGSLRSRSPAVVPYVDHLLKNPMVSNSLRPDLVIQIGHPLISTEIPRMIRESMRNSESGDDAAIMNHVLIHPHHSVERSDPDFTLTHRISTEVAPFLGAVSKQLESVENPCSSDLASLVLLGRMLGKRIPNIINLASHKATMGLVGQATLTEPQVVLEMTRTVNECGMKLPLFLSNSMPVRDADSFFYPKNNLGCVGVNRGASGIDGIISSAVGFAEGQNNHTALLIGDLATLHDVNSLHGLANAQSNAKTPPLTTVVVNNDGGGIFSFLPIAKHGNEVGFDEFFGTPTSTFSFQKGAAAFGLAYDQAGSGSKFKAAFQSALLSSESRIVEATVVSREINVVVHRQIAAMTNEFLTRTLEGAVDKALSRTRLPIKVFTSNEKVNADVTNKKTLLLLHGWMGDKTEWDETGMILAQKMPSEWSIISVDLKCHGQAHNLDFDIQRIINALQLGKSASSVPLEFDIDALAKSVLQSLAEDHGITKIDAIAGYSLGGRVALAMNRICKSGTILKRYSILNSDARLILLGSFPGSTDKITSEPLPDESAERALRFQADRLIAEKLRVIGNKATLMRQSPSHQYDVWGEFLKSWYNAPIWGDLKARNPTLYRVMLKKRAATLAIRSEELSWIVELCSSGSNSCMDWSFTTPSKTMFVAGDLDPKYSKVGKEWKERQSDLHFVVISDAGHALLTEAPDTVAEQIRLFVMESEGSTETTLDETSLQVIDTEFKEKGDSMTDRMPVLPTMEVLQKRRPAVLDFESFAIDMASSDRSEKGVVGIGWGDQSGLSELNRVKQRNGFILQLVSDDGVAVGVGEVSPLRGLHPESLEQAQAQLMMLKKHIEIAHEIPRIDPVEILRLDGGLNDYIIKLLEAIEFEDLLSSVKSGLEMALISFSCQVLKMPVLNCLAQYSASQQPPLATLPLNGLITRTPKATATLQLARKEEKSVSFPSLKVKVGHQDAASDAVSLSVALQETSMVRADANRAWTEAAALEFLTALDGLDVDVIHRIEFVEEPIMKVNDWSLQKQVKTLERWYQDSGVKYALDESIADLVMLHDGKFENIREALISALNGTVGCASLVLKPALLGLELSLQLSKVAHQDLGIGAVFSSSFDSGVGLAYTAFLAATSDLASGLPQKQLRAHGIGTFSMLKGDTLSPSFGSYVNEKGILQVASLSRAFFGLGLDEMKGSFPPELPEADLSDRSDYYRASAATSSSGREISLVVSLPLPFSDDVAAARFTDLPQQSRWSPWLSSVAYLDAGRETEWTLNIRGIKLSWRAVSSILDKPYRGIQWESISGLKNLGIVEFVPNETNRDVCLMKVRMTIIAPRIVSTLFPGASVFLEDFLQNKLLKWSLEMFRDVVKGDLALERGDIELGDALFDAVEGKANAIEATLSSLPLMNDVNGSGKS